MALEIYNSLTRRIEPFEPLHAPRATVYMCGPTVYNYAHIGNFRTFLTGDLLRRYLDFRGFDVFFIMNITDVDDRLIAAAAKDGKELGDHTKPFIDAFHEDREYLRIKPADIYPRATESIPSMVSLVGQLEAKGLAYRAEDHSVYFAVDRFSGYGRLSQLDKRELKIGARVNSDEYDKEDARDFALWKAASPQDEQVCAAWDAPFGRGRPGWHLECSAMALGELRNRFQIETLDIHAGGVDLRFPHHENEIAQSEGATGREFARYWLHGEFLNIDGTKMSKRFGNYLTPRDLRQEGFDGSAVRLLMFQTHYRQKLNFTDKGLTDARDAVQRLTEFRDRVRALAADASPGVNEAADSLRAEFAVALDDDLNAPRAVAALFSFARGGNRAMDQGHWSAAQAASAREAIDAVDEVLQLQPAEQIIDDDAVAWIEDQIGLRVEAKKRKDFQEADRIRAEVAERGFELEDTPSGTRWKRAER